MNYPSEGLEVLIKTPDNSWEFAYYKNNSWWRGLPDNPDDELVTYTVTEWKYRNE